MAEPALGRGISASVSRSIPQLALCAGTFIGGLSSQARVHRPWESMAEGRVGLGKKPREKHSVSLEVHCTRIFRGCLFSYVMDDNRNLFDFRSNETFQAFGRHFG